MLRDLEILAKRLLFMCHPFWNTVLLSVSTSYSLNRLEGVQRSSLYRREL